MLRHVSPSSDSLSVEFGRGMKLGDEGFGSGGNDEDDVDDEDRSGRWRRDMLV